MRYLFLIIPITIERFVAKYIKTDNSCLSANVIDKGDDCIRKRENK